MTIIICDQLSGPPTWTASFRDLTLYCDIFLHSPVVLESNDPDPYYHWLKSKGAMDFVRDIVRPGSESGLIIAPKKTRPYTVVVDRIVPENVWEIITRIKSNI